MPYAPRHDEQLPYHLYMTDKSKDIGGRGSTMANGQGQCIMYFRKSIHSHSAFLYLRVQMGTGELLQQPDRMLPRDNPQWTSIPSRKE